MKAGEKNALSGLQGDIFEKGRTWLQFLLKHREDIESMCSAENMTQYIQSLPKLKQLYERIQPPRQKNQKVAKDFEAFLKSKAGFGNLCDALNGMSKKDRCDFYGLGKLWDEKTDLPTKSETAEERVAEFKVLLDEGILRTKCSLEDVLMLVADYRTIRRTRNDINHAGNIKISKALMNRREVDGLIRRCLDRIENMGLGEQR